MTASCSVPEIERRRPGAAYAVVKSADDRRALVVAVQLSEHRAASDTLHPVLVCTEGVMQFADHLDLSRSQSPEGVGRAATALAADPELMTLGGRALSADDLAVGCGVDISD